MKSPNVYGGYFKYPRIPAINVPYNLTSNGLMGYLASDRGYVYTSKEDIQIEEPLMRYLKIGGGGVITSSNSQGLWIRN